MTAEFFKKCEQNDVNIFSLRLCIQLKKSHHLQNVQKLMISYLANESDYKPNYYNAPCIFLLL